LLLVTVVFWRGVLSELAGPPGRTPGDAADAGWAMATAQASTRGMVAASAGHLRRICAPFSYRACRDKAQTAEHNGKWRISPFNGSFPPPCHALGQRLTFPVSVPDNRSRNGNMLLPANG
jgi:hypothetical protein